jgi:hypothetical protein
MTASISYSHRMLHPGPRPAASGRRRSVQEGADDEIPTTAASEHRRLPALRAAHHGGPDRRRSQLLGRGRPGSRLGRSRLVALPVTAGGRAGVASPFALKAGSGTGMLTNAHLPRQTPVIERLGRISPEGDGLGLRLAAPTRVLITQQTRLDLGVQAGVGVSDLTDHMQSRLGRQPPRLQLRIDELLQLLPGDPAPPASQSATLQVRTRTSRDSTRVRAHVPATRPNRSRR